MKLLKMSNYKTKLNKSQIVPQKYKDIYNIDYEYNTLYEYLKIKNQKIKNELKNFFK